MRATSRRSDLINATRGGANDSLAVRPAVHSKFDRSAVLFAFCCEHEKDQVRFQIGPCYHLIDRKIQIGRRMLKYKRQLNTRIQLA